MEVNHFLVLICRLEKSVHLQHSLRGICLSGGIYFWKELYGQGAIFRKAIFLRDDYPWEQLSGGQSNSGAITLEGNFLGGNYSGGNHPGDNYLGGNYPGGNFPRGNCPRTNIQIQPALLMILTVDCRINFVHIDGRINFDYHKNKIVRKLVKECTPYPGYICINISKYTKKDYDDICNFSVFLLVFVAEVLPEKQ